MVENGKRKGPLLGADVTCRFHQMCPPPPDILCACRNSRSAFSCKSRLPTDKYENVYWLLSTRRPLKWLNSPEIRPRTQKLRRHSLGQNLCQLASSWGRMGNRTSSCPIGLSPNQLTEPYRCRSCTSKSEFSAWAAQAKAMKAPNATAKPLTTARDTLTTKATATDDCPADVETLGRNSWTLLHSIAATYPASPSAAQKDDVVGFVKLFSRLYPCWVCAEDFQAYIRKDPVKAGSRGEFGTWLCNAHNDVNKKLGKPVFDCSKWEERWRTGWKDGRCE